MSNGDIVYRKHLSVWAKHTCVPLAIIIVSLASLVLSATLVSPDLRLFTLPVGFVALLVGCVGYYWMDWDWRNDPLHHFRRHDYAGAQTPLLPAKPARSDFGRAHRQRGIGDARLGRGSAEIWRCVRMSLVGADEPKIFERVANPQAIQQEISRRQHNKAERRAKYDAMQQRQILGEYLDSVNEGDQPLSPAVAVGAGSIAGEESTASLIKPASNPDRNRPPRLPRKLLRASSATEPAEPASARSDNRRRPPRFQSGGP